jgi:hypothetical protein
MVFAAALRLAFALAIGLELGTYDIGSTEGALKE